MCAVSSVQCVASGEFDFQIKSQREHQKLFIYSSGSRLESNTVVFSRFSISSSFAILLAATPTSRGRPGRGREPVRPAATTGRP